MSIEAVFDPYSEEILTASALPEHAGGLSAEDFPGTVIMTFSEKIIHRVAGMEGVEEIGFLLAGSKVPVYRLRIDCLPKLGDFSAGDAGMDVRSASQSNTAPACYNIPRYAAVLRVGMGAPMAAAFMEELIAKGGRKFIVFGSCGLLTGDLPPGHIIVPDKARRDEGTSYHYAPPADYIKVRNGFYLAGMLKVLEVPCVVGGVWTTDALYRETKNNAAQRRAEGCIAVDMECAALQAVCDFRGCELFQFIYAEDSLKGDQWDPRSMGQVPASQLESHLQLALEIARRV